MTYNKPSSGDDAARPGSLAIAIAAVLALWAPAALAANDTGVPDDAGKHYVEAPVEESGKVAGKIVAARATPLVERYIIPKQVEICGRGYRDARVVSVEAGHLRDVVVYLADVPSGKGFSAAAKKVTINQVGCRFEPYLSVLMNGGELEAINSDPLLHNIHIYKLLSQGRRTVASVSQPRRGDIMAMSVHLEGNAKALKVECDAHDFMHAFVFVARNPYYAMVSSDGSFEIGDIPPGSYELRAWHPHLGERKQRVEILADTTAEATFEF